MMSNTRYYVGVDVGGTFTDCVVLDQGGTVVAMDKSPTVPADPSAGVLDALSFAAKKLGVPLEALLRSCLGFVHGCTIATNAMLERKGSVAGIITTKGHEDTILVGRVYQKRAGLPERQIIHESHLMKAHPPVAPRPLIKGVSERGDYRGRIVVSLNEEEVVSAIDELAGKGVKSVAVCFLWSFLNPDHERKVRAIILSRHPDMFVVLSTDVAPLMGEYERTATTALSAYLGPSTNAYLKTLRMQLRERGLATDLLLMHSGGGVTSVEGALLKPILLLDSGPTGGTLGAQFFSRVYDQPNLVCMDMGGTSLDVSLIINGEFLTEEMPVIAQYTFMTPKVKVESIGAGGGSIAWIDPEGILKVGPQSAGALPGPACYGRGGTEPTVTDADLVLGYLNPDYFWAGRMPLLLEKAKEAVGKAADRMGMSVIDTAAGIIQIVSSQMADLIRKLTIENGIDPRQFVLFSLGGAGALHACFIAKELGMQKVCIPAAASVFSALGMCVADMAHSMETSRFFKFPLAETEVQAINDIYSDLEGKLQRQFAEEDIALPKVTWMRLMYLRYGGQVHEVSITVAARELHHEDGGMLQERFEKRYEEIFGRGSAYREAGIEVVKYRVEGRCKRVVAEMAEPTGEAAPDAGEACKGRRTVYFERTAWETAVYDWPMLKPGHRLAGPALVEREGDTIVVPPFAEGTVDRFNNVWITLSTEAGARTGKTAGLDPITFEVLRHRLWMLNEEQAKIACRISGSKIIYEINDYSASLLTSAGESLFVGAQVTRLANSLHIIVQNIIRLFQENPGINDGDMFITNDPWIGASHQNDFCLLAPVFWQGEIICWTGIVMHEGDVGGQGVLGPFAQDVFSEPPLIPPLKLIEQGTFRTDIERLLLRNTRTPELNALDLRARIASQNVIRVRIYDIVRKYGKETFLEVQQRIKLSTVEALRRRLKELPDGVWREEGFIDHNGFENRLFRLAVTMTKRGDRLILDFRGTEKQAKGSVNCAPPGLYGAIFSALLPMMCYDLAWCPGALHEIVEVISEEGALNNARFPAAVQAATTGNMRATGDVLRSCLAKMYAASEKYQGEVQAGWGSGNNTFKAVGIHKDNPKKPLINLYHLAPGGGARGWWDGLDAAGLPGSPGMSIANVESDEKDGMVMVLYRRLHPDTAGRGLLRGGAGMESAVIPYDCAGLLKTNVYAQGFNHPESKGIYGGYPGSIQMAAILRRARVFQLFQKSYLPTSWEEIPYDEFELREAKAVADLSPGDVEITLWAGGGGYGDPLERNPEAVRQDVENLLCSDPAQYGVVLKEGMVDAPATEVLRNALRQERLGGTRPVTATNPTDGKGKLVFPVAKCFHVLSFGDGAQISCAKCGYHYGPSRQDPKKTAHVFTMTPEELSPLNRYASVGEETVIRGFCCPRCALLIGVEVRKAEDPILFDTELEVGVL